MAVILKKIFYLFTFRERGREGEREVKQHRYEKETWMGYPLHALRPGTEPQPSTCPDLEPNQLSHTAQSGSNFFNIRIE